MTEVPETLESAGQIIEPESDANCFGPGELAMLMDRKSRRYLLTLDEADTFHSHLGRLRHDQLIGNSVGGWYRTDRGHILLAVRPTLGDYVRHMPRGPQIIYQKDLGNIVSFADIFPGATVIEGGLGSGALTAALLRAAGREGRVITYEIDESVLPKAMRNIHRVVPDTSNLEVKIGNIYEGIEERDVDRVVLDVPEPWNSVGTIGDALVMGGVMLSFLPTVLQVHRLVGALESDGRFQLVESLETLLRTWHVTERSVRPSHRMVAHSGFLTTAVRCLPRPAGGRPTVSRSMNHTPKTRRNSPMDLMNRDSTLEFLSGHVKTDMLMKHLLSVEASMRGYARRCGEDEERWGIAGLLHDFDWEVCPTPESHPTYGAQILRDSGYPEDIIRAVLTHGEHTGIPRESLMEHTLFAVDELSGFIRAVALVRPNKSLEEVTPRSVRRKMKDKAFAKDVNRGDIQKGADELGVDLDEHISFIVESMMPVSVRIGLTEPSA